MFHMTTFRESSTLMSEGVLRVWQKGSGCTQDKKGWEPLIYKMFCWVPFSNTGGDKPQLQVKIIFYQQPYYIVLLNNLASALASSKWPDSSATHNTKLHNQIVSSSDQVLL